MIIRGKKISDRVKYWVRPDIINRIQEGSIQVYYDSNIEEILDQEVIINQKTSYKARS